MAGIDKIYLNKKDIPAFYEYLKSIDKDFKAYFPNAESILDWTYYNQQSTPELLNNWITDLIPVSNFPTIVDRWLAHREDLPDMIRERLEEQYGKGWSKGFSNIEIFNEPIYKEDDRELSHKFRVTDWTKCNGRRWTKPIKFWIITVWQESYRYYTSLNRFIPDDYITPDLLDLDFHWGGSTYRFKSIKAVFRFLRKHGFPKGTLITIMDWKYNISRITIKFI